MMINPLRRVQVTKEDSQERSSEYKRIKKSLNLGLTNKLNSQHQLVNRTAENRKKHKN